MAKFYGTVGYAITSETAPGVWTDGITERTYYGDFLKVSSRWFNSQQVNDNLRITNRISIIADAFAYQNFSSIKYVIVGGTKWKVTDIEVDRPRLILTLGGEYNG